MKESRGEGRKLHIVYFLCHNGKMDHPHLLWVNHLNCHGVRLRGEHIQSLSSSSSSCSSSSITLIVCNTDVKRRLSQLRGEDMPECFAWSYKRFTNSLIGCIMIF
ncbi:hypothetical protein IEQ34_007071 [Dendrobium chrysotoxum]|uniref:SOSEKI DIX-like domain-containing protein n=1 Tax=Dendrobium chrysotoxum TaxID=161865 RepID=A0AAV7H9X2_DENCH|nr:hypothetical protein IEQ34_007071 [Dendrobium chrysotoxum]